MKPRYIKSLETEIDAGTRYVHISKKFVYNVELGRFLFLKGVTYNRGLRAMKRLRLKLKDQLRRERRALKKTRPTDGITSHT